MSLGIFPKVFSKRQLPKCSIFQVTTSQDYPSRPHCNLWCFSGSNLSFGSYSLGNCTFGKLLLGKLSLGKSLMKNCFWKNTYNPVKIGMINDYEKKETIQQMLGITRIRKQTKDFVQSSLKSYSLWIVGNPRVYFKQTVNSYFCYCWGILIFLKKMKEKIQTTRRRNILLI